MSIILKLSFIDTDKSMNSFLNKNCRRKKNYHSCFIINGCYQNYNNCIVLCFIYKQKLYLMAIYIRHFRIKLNDS